MHKPGNDRANELYYWRASDIGIGDHGYAEVDELTHNDEFQAWIENVMRRFPIGPYSQFVKYYCAFASVVGKTETMQEDLHSFLARYEGLHSLDFDVARTNVTEKEYKGAAVYAPGQKQRLLELERGVIREYYER